MPLFSSLLHDTDPVDDDLEPEDDLFSPSNPVFPVHPRSIDERNSALFHRSRIPTTPPGPVGFSPNAYRRILRRFEAQTRESDEKYRRLQYAIPSSSLINKL